jgi:GLPGLI family protein
VNLKSKEATILANISNTKMAVATSESFFQIEKTNSFSLESGSKKLTIAGLECKSGVIQSKSADQKIDTTYVWYSTSYAAIPFQFETASAPGLIVSIQQDKNSFWELSEIMPGNLSPEIFEVPADYKPMSMTEFQEYLAALAELEIEVENIELD